jgi:hypothetical protein
MKRLLWIVFVSVVLLSLIGSSVLAQGINTGTGKTNIFMQNLGAGNAQVTVKFYREGTGALDWDYTIPNAIPPKGAANLLYPNFQVPDNWAGAAELASTEPIAAIVNMFWDGNSTAAAYSGIDAPATEAFLPNLLKIVNRQTRVTVQNTEGTQASIVIKFYNRNGQEVGTKNDTIPAKAEVTYNLDNVAEADFSATAGTGSLYITSNTKIAVMASLHYPDGSGAYSGVSRGDTVLWVPGVFRREGPANWTIGAIYSATIFQNLGASPANITVDLIGKPPLINTSFTDVIQPKASYGINTRSQGTMPPDKWNAAIAALGSNWNGTIKVTCTNGQPLAGVSLYFNKGIASDLAAYEAIRNSDATTNALSMPAVYRKMAIPQWSTTLVQNLDNAAATINVKFYKGDGTQAGAAAGYDVPIPANGSVGLNLKTTVNLPQQALIDLGDNFNGAMYVTSTTGQHIIGMTLFFIENASRVLGYSGFPVP